MAGGYDTPRQRTRAATLGQRAAEQRSPAGAPPDDVGVAGEPRPCWLSVGETPRAGHVWAWLPGPAGTWRALVVVEVDATEVHARALPPPAGPPGSST